MGTQPDTADHWAVKHPLCLPSTREPNVAAIANVSTGARIQCKLCKCRQRLLLLINCASLAAPLHMTAQECTQRGPLLAARIFESRHGAQLGSEAQPRPLAVIAATAVPGTAAVAAGAAVMRARRVVLAVVAVGAVVPATSYQKSRNCSGTSGYYSDSASGRRMCSRSCHTAAAQATYSSCLKLRERRWPEYSSRSGGTLSAASLSLTSLQCERWTGFITRHK
jgi:hypothetical protein